MAKGTTIGFLNFGIDGDNKELMKKLEQAEKEAVSIEQIFENIKLNVGGSPLSTDIQKAQIAADKLAVSQNKVTQSVHNTVAAENKATEAIEKATNAKKSGLLIDQKRNTELANTAIAVAKSENIKANTLVKQEEARRKAIYDEERLAGLQKRNALIGVQGQKDMAAAYGLTNKTMFDQKNLLQQASSALGIYFSIYQAGAFVKELAMVSGEFEKQRLSLRAIIQDSASADKIFNQIKDLAVYSPFNFKELTDYAKQLSAFSIPTNEIFDTMTRLADISAGLGVDMNRIILAYGQVRSASVLRGQELRQFTEAGIPLVDELAKKFGELEGKVISAGDVFDKISNREVPFAMVKDIFTDLTSEGGKFYQMQEIQATSLAGKISNLRDAYDIMLDSIGSANSETLKGAVDALVGIMDNWRDYLNIIKTIVAAYGVYRATLIAVSVIEKTNLAVKREAIILMRSYAAQNMSLSKTQAVTAAQTELLTRKLNGLKSALSFNPAALALTGITVAIGLIASYVSHQQELEEQLFKTIHAINEESKSVNTHLDRLKELAKSTDSNSNASKERVKILNKLSEIEPTVAREIKNHADNLDLLTIAQEKYNNSINIRKFATYAANEGSGLFTSNLLETLKELNEAQNKADLYSSKLVLGYSKIEEALSRWNSEGKDVTGTMSDLESSTLDSLNAIVSSSSNVTDKIIQIRKLAFNSSGNERIALFDLSNMIDEGSFNSWINSYQNLNKATSEADADINTFVQNLKGYLKVNNLDIKENENTIRSLIKSWDDLGLASQKQILLKLGIEWDGKENDESQLSEWQNLLQSKLGNTITIQTDTNINSVTEEMEKKYKELKTRIDKTKPILIKFGFDFDKNAFPSPAEISPVIKQLSDSYIADQKDVTNLDAAAKSLGKTLKDLYEPKDKGEKKDKFTEDLKRQVEIVKAAKSEYEKLIKVMSREEAMNKIRGISEYSSIGNIDLSDQGYIDYLSEQLKKVESRNTTAAKNVRVTWNKELGQIQIEQITEKAQYEIDRIEKYLSNYKTDFDFYKRILGITGDKSQAAKLAFGANNPVKEYIDTLKDAFKKSSGISFSDFIKLDDSNKLKLLVNKQNANIFNQIESAQKDEVSRRQGIYAESLKEFASYQDKRLALQYEYDEKIKIAEENGNKGLADRLRSSLSNELLKLTPDYQKFFTSIYSLTKDKAIQIGNLIKTNLKEQLDKGVISTQDYYEGIKRINEELKKSKKGIDYLGKLQSGGLDGLFGAMDEKASSDYQSALIDFKKFSDQRNESLAVGDKITANMNQDSMNMADGVMKGAQNMQSFAGAAQGAIGAVDKIVVAIDQSVRATQQLVDQFAELAESRGIDTDKGTWGDIKGLMNTMSEVNAKAKASWDSAKGGDAAGALSNAVGIVTSGLTALNTWHDKKLNKTIEESVSRVKHLQQAYEDLGRTITRQLGGITANQAKEQLDNQKNQLSELEKQRQAEIDKKKTDWDVVLDLEGQIKEAQDKIKFFYEDLFEELYDFNLKDVSDQLASALVDAFSAGEDAAKAFDNTVADVMRNVIKEMISMNVLQKSMDSLREYLFGANGIFTDGDFSTSDAAGLTAQLAALKGSIGDAKKIWDTINQAAGGILDESANKDTLSKGIQSLTEDTGNLVASYLNAIRADVAAQRVFLLQLVQLAQVNSNTFALQLAELIKIQVNTLATANNTREIADTVRETNSILRNATTPGSGTSINT